MKIEKHNLIIVITAVLGCVVLFQSLFYLQEADYVGQLPLWQGRFDLIPENAFDVTLKGRLNKTRFPTIPGIAPPVKGDWPADNVFWRDVLVLEVIDQVSGNATDIYIVKWEQYQMYWGPMSGDTELGGIPLFRLSMAKVVEFRGYTFDVRGVDNKRYHIIYVEEAEIVSDYDYSELWSGEPDVRDAPRKALWWMKEKTGRIYGGSKSAADTINYYLYQEKSDFLESVYSQHFIDMYNDSIYIVLTKIDEETTGRVLELIHPSPHTTVHFLKGPAPRYELEEWFERVNDLLPELRRNGVKVYAASICENATILLQIDEVSSSKVEIIEYILREEVPLGVLVIRRGYPVEIT